MGLSHSFAKPSTASSEPPKEPDGADLATPQTTEAQDQDAIVDEVPPLNNGKCQNPGTLPDLHRKCRDLMPVSFDGLKILLNNHVSSHFQTAHLINLATTQQTGHGSEPSGYKFNTTFIGNGRLDDSPGDMYPVFFGDIDTDGNVSANVVHYVTQRLRLRYNGQFRTNARTVQESHQAQVMAEYFGSDYTLSAVVANLNRDREPEILVGQYLKAITQNLTLGTEVSYNNSSVAGLVPLGKRFDVTFAARLETGPEATWSMTWGRLSGLQLSTYQKASETLQIGVEATVNQASKEVVTQLGYQASMPSRHYVFRGMVDSKGTIGSTLEKGFQPFPMTFTISAFMNQKNNNFRLGCGFVLK